MPDGTQWIKDINDDRKKALGPAADLKKGIADAIAKHSAKDDAGLNAALKIILVSKTKLVTANTELDASAKGLATWVAAEKKKILKDSKYDQCKTLLSQAQIEVADYKKLIEEQKKVPTRI